MASIFKTKEMIIIPNDKIIEVMQAVIDKYLKPKFIELGMSASGDWLNALEARAELNKGEVWGMDYTVYLVRGRAPNQDQSHKALARFAVGMVHKNEGFKQWLRIRGVEQYGIQIAYKIGKEGTNYYPEGTDLLEVLGSKEVSDFINKQIGDYIVSELKLNIVKRTKEILN